MSDRNSIIQKVASLIGDKMDGDTVHLLDSYMDIAVRNACKYIALNRPINHEKLLETGFQNAVVLVTPEGTFGREYIPLDLITLNMPNEPILVGDKLFNVVFGNSTGDYWRGQPVGSIMSLELSGNHGIPYYYIEGTKLFFGFPVATFGTFQTIDFYVYTYRSVQDFPEELDEYIVAELMKLIGAEAQKQQMEKANV